MTTSGPRTLREIAVVELCAWLGVGAVGIVAAAFHAAMTDPFGDKGPVLGPLVLGSISGSLFGLLVADRRLRTGAYRSGWALLAGGPCAVAGVAAGALVADTTGSYSILALPFIVGLTSYAGYYVVSSAVFHHANPRTGKI